MALILSGYIEGGEIGIFQIIKFFYFLLRKLLYGFCLLKDFLDIVLDIFHQLVFLRKHAQKSFNVCEIYGRFIFCQEIIHRRLCNLIYNFKGRKGPGCDAGSGIRSDHLLKFCLGLRLINSRYIQRTIL